jgi:hypothetical protein
MPSRMIPRLTLFLALACAAPLWADDSFTKALSPADFQAAGLGKLTPDELSRLDQLVRGQQTGAVAKAKEETAKSVSLLVRAQVQAEDLKKESAGILEKVKVMLKPGTEVVYTTLDSAIVAIHEIDFGKGGAVFTLANGQRWMTSEDDDWPSTKSGPVRARVVPGSMGSFFLDIEHGGRPRVRFVGNVAPAQAAPAAAQ